MKIKHFRNFFFYAVKKKKKNYKMIRCLIFLFFFISLLLCFFMTNDKKESYQKLEKKEILCFLTVRPSETFFELCQRFTENYQVYVVVDDNSYRIPYPPNQNLTIVRIDSNECYRAGFHSTVIYFQNQSCSRDKALYYFSKQKNLRYRHIWMIEEDVFIPCSNTLTDLDKKYKNGDLLCKDSVRREECPEWTHWQHSDKVIAYSNYPASIFSFTMICAIRISRRLLKDIYRFASKYNQLFIDELLFLTISTKNKRKIRFPEEMKHIYYIDDGKLIPEKKENVNKKYIYHPMKNIELQKILKA